ncbi:MAG: hypothetical protein GY951_09140 [Psychromonas sp.]|nr:hypothetical protein [Psychromonas sp.]
MKITLRTLGVIGILIFGTGFWFTFGVPGYIEEAGKEFIKDQIKKETKEKIDSIKIESKDNKLYQLASKYLKKHEQQIDSLRSQLENKAHEKLAAIIAEMRDLSCECRKKYEQRIKENIIIRIANLEQAKESIVDFMKTKYMEVVNKLKLDFRIFTSSNLLVFVFLLAILLFKSRAIAHLYLPGLLLALSTVICSYFYIFEQNWFFTILYNNYVGWGYLAYLCILFGFLCDIIFNKARITTEIINGILNAIGSAASVVPC